jgi:hypothetical protein
MVALSLSKTIKMYPAIGWVRADSVASEELLSDVNSLRKENDLLKGRLADLERQGAPESLNLAGMDEPFVFNVVWQGAGDHEDSHQLLSASWSDIFASIGPSLVEYPSDDKANRIIASAMYRRLNAAKSAPSGVKIVLYDFETVRLQLAALGVIQLKYSESTSGGMALFWAMTEKGQRVLLSLRTVKSYKLQP